MDHERKVTYQMGQELAKKFEMDFFLETSAYHNVGVDRIFTKIALLDQEFVFFVFVFSFCLSLFQCRNHSIMLQACSFGKLSLVSQILEEKPQSIYDKDKVLIIILFYFILFYFILFYFILFYFILFYFILFYFMFCYFILFYFILFYVTLCYFILFYFILFYFILFYFILFYFILFYFILFYFILFYFILFYFILFYFILFLVIYLFLM